jgi:hypothetical protein
MAMPFEPSEVLLPTHAGLSGAPIIPARKELGLNYGKKGNNKTVAPVLSNTQRCCRTILRSDRGTFSALIDFLHVMQQQPFILGDSLRHREAATPHVRDGRPIQCWQFNLAFRASHPEQCAWSALFDSIQ